MRTRLVWMVLVLGVIGGCGGGAAEKKPVAAAPEPAAKEAEPPPADPAERLLVAMRGFTADVCACTSAACIEGVEARMMEWAMVHLDELETMEPTAAQDTEADQLDAELKACKARYVSAAPAGSSVAAKPLPPGGTGSKACDAYLASFGQVLARCKDKLGPAYDQMIQSWNMQVDAFAEWSTLDAEQLKYTVEAAEAGCRSANDGIRQAAASMGCKV